MAPSSPRRKEGPPAALPAKTAGAPPRKRKRTPPSPPKPFQRTWPPADEVHILEALAAHRRAHGGQLPTDLDLFDALRGRLERHGVGVRELHEKQRSLKRRFDRDVQKVAPPADEHECRLYLLSRQVWANDSPPEPPVAQVKAPSPLEPPAAEATQAKSKGSLAPKPRTLAEMRDLYPYLVDEAMVLNNSPVVHNLLPGIEDEEARALNKKIKRARKRLNNALTELARKKNMEMPIVFLCPSAKLQQENSRVEKMGDMDISDKEELAKLKYELAELRQIVMASRNQGIRCEYDESRPQSIVAENQISCNIVEKKIQVPNDLPHGKNEVVTSKYKYEGVLPRNVPCDNLKLQGLIKPPFKKSRGRMRKIDTESQIQCNLKLQGLIKPPFKKSDGRTRKIDTESQIQCNLGDKEVILLSLQSPHHPVGKAILQPSCQSTMVGGKKFGSGCYKVLVREVLKRDALLFHEDGKMKMMKDALECSIAWPSYLVKDNAISKAPRH